MEPNNEVVLEFPSMVRIYKDGHAERFSGTTIVPASIDTITGVASKDVMIDASTGVSARLYKPDLAKIEPESKLPLLVYYHGGGFCFESAFSPLHHNYLNSVCSQANIIIVSVEYRLAPEHPLPAAYDDSWNALQWAFSSDQDECLKKYVDFERVFVAGDSAGGNIAHYVLMRSQVKMKGLVLGHPFFWGTTRLESEIAKPGISTLLDPNSVDALWPLVCSGTSGNDDPRINPLVDGAPALEGLSCENVLVCVAEKDVLRDRGKVYHEKLRSSGWRGKVELLESEGEDHVFHLLKPGCEKALELMKVLVAFFDRE